MGVATGCGCKAVYRFPVYVHFCRSIPTFCLFKKMFFVLLPVLFVIKFYVYIFLRSINTYRRLRASYGSHMKAAHNVLYIKN